MIMATKLDMLKRPNTYEFIYTSSFSLLASHVSCEEQLVNSVRLQFR